MARCLRAPARTRRAARPCRRRREVCHGRAGSAVRWGRRGRAGRQIRTVCAVREIRTVRTVRITRPARQHAQVAPISLPARPVRPVRPWELTVIHTSLQLTRLGNIPNLHHDHQLSCIHHLNRSTL